MLVWAVRVLTIIPARIGSSRLPEKPLSIICGEPLAHLVTRKALEFALSDEIVVASDDDRVLDVVRPLGIRGVKTSQLHRSGTERIAEVLALPEYASVDLVLNVQGDQPFLPFEAAQGALRQLEAGFGIGTAAVPLSEVDVSNRNIVKVAIDRCGEARHFWRGPVGGVKLDAVMGVFHHLGVYAYTRESVLEWVRLPDCVEEFSQQLEQLRPLRNGISIGVEVVQCVAPLAVDTPSDLRRAQVVREQTSEQSRKSA
jgi:3-deoxy-manno-octulosonate cytidylyltransferase (CMP-KDO synthetase)